MNKKSLSERDICTKLITPAIVQAGWDIDAQIREEVRLTKGRVIVRGKLVARGKEKRADYVLYYKPNIPIAVIEAKDNNHGVSDGMQQAIAYADMLGFPFAFSSNGDGFWEHDRSGTSKRIESELSLSGFPSPDIMRKDVGVDGDAQRIGQLAWLLFLKISNEPVEFIDEALYLKWMTRGFPKKGDLLFVTEGHTMGFVGMLDFDFKYALAQRTIDLQPFCDSYGRFYLYYLLSEPFQAAIGTNATGSAAQGIKAAKLKRIRVVVPPLAEQRRIVAKVDQLMALVDQLETQLTASRATAAKLMEAVVAELTASSAPSQREAAVTHRTKPKQRAHA